MDWMGVRMVCIWICSGIPLDTSDTLDIIVSLDSLIQFVLRTRIAIV